MKTLTAALLFAFIPVTAPAQAALPAVVINEFMASNTRAVPDITDFEDYPDWIELKNTTDGPVALDTYFLSDNPLRPLKWHFPAGASIPPHGFVVVIADGHDAAPGQIFPRGYWPWKNFVVEKYHANFSLAAEGESVLLSEATGVGSEALVIPADPPAVPPSAVAVWKFRDDGADLGASWRERLFDDSAWRSGPAKLGYGDPSATVVSYGPSANNKYITTYFRHHFNVANPANYDALALRLLVDDGCIVYLNGTEVLRRNMPEGAVNFRTSASSAVGGSDESTYFNYSISPGILVAGDNVLAVEVHQDGANSSDLGFDLGLVGSFHTGSSVIDTFTYGQQIADVSAGRDQTDPGVWTQFVEPTPGAENTSAPVNDLRVHGPVVSVSLASGFYNSDQTVSLSSTGGSIHYTLDGSNPTSTSPVYTTPIRITATTVMRARGFEPGKAPGPIVTRTYFRGETPINVPYVSLVADPNTLFGDKIGIYANKHETVTGSYGLNDVYKNKDAPGYVEFFAPDGSGFAAGCGIRVGGENNWVHPQKALNVAIRGKYGDDNITYDLFPGSGIPVHTAFTLRDGGDNWDKDMLRDALYPKLADGYMNVDTADYRPSVVFINGAYFGIHDVRQRWDEMWFFEKYHLQADKIDHLLYGHITSPTTTLGVDKGNTDDWLALLDFLNRSDLTIATNWAYVEARMDVDSFIDFVIGESYGNNSAWHHNREFWKARVPGGRWRWFFTDMDRTFSTSRLSGVLGDMLGSDEVLVRLKTNPGFVARLAQRYAAHMAGTFRPARVQSILSEMDEEVSALVPRHAARWAPYGTTVAVRANNIQEIKDYATQRAQNFAGELAARFNLKAPVDFTLQVDDPARGSVFVEGVPVEPSTFKVFPDLPLTLRAVPAPGYVFDSWAGPSGGDTITLSVAGAQMVQARFLPSGETVVGGTLDGDLSLNSSGSPYTLESDLIIPPGRSLTIGPGVTINMPANRNLRVQGVLAINGTAAEPVRISGRNGARWGAISFEDPALPSTLSHLIVRHATKGFDPVLYNSAITGHNAEVTMDFVDVQECESPIYMYGGSSILRDSVLHNPYTGDCMHVKKGRGVIQRCVFLGNNAPDTDAIDFDGATSGLIEGCRIYRFQGSNSDGIDVGEATTNLVVQNNLIYYNSDKGISVGQGSSVVFKHNLVVGCVLGVGVKDTGSLAVVDQNTFASCGTGVAVYEKNFSEGGGAAIVKNNIIAKSGVAPVSVDALSTLTAAYNLSDSIEIPGPNNLVAEPGFIAPGLLDFELKLSSPAINSGDPSHEADPDNSRADIGARYVYSASDYPYTLGSPVLISEVLANSGLGGDWVELYNTTSQPVDIGGWFLSDDAADLQKYRIPFGTILPARGYSVFYEDRNFGVQSLDTNKVSAFALGADGETVFLSSARNDELSDYRTSAQFGSADEGITWGAWQKKNSDSFKFVELSSPTPGASNSAPRVGPIVISEIMYNPGGVNTGDAEYIELSNISEAAVTLYDAKAAVPWKLAGGVDYQFPVSPALTVAPGERLLLVKSRTLFNQVYGTLVPAGTRIFEWTPDQSLSNGGETVRLERPSAVNASGIWHYIAVDEVAYDDAAPWPLTPDGTGPSLTRAAERVFGSDFNDWIAASPSPGTGTTPSLDSDADGLPDEFEIAHGLNPADPNDAALDADGDLQSNLAEYLAGTDPRDPTDNLHLTVSFEGGHPLLHLSVVAGKSYTVQYSDALGAQPWQSLQEVLHAEATGLLDMPDANALTAHRFYRVVTP